MEAEKNIRLRITEKVHKKFKKMAKKFGRKLSFS